MKLKTLLAAAILGGASSLAHADSASAINHVDIYYIPKADLDISLSGVGSGKDDGDGFGMRGRALISDMLFLSGEYQTVEYDDSGLEIDQFRAGLGLAGAVHSDLFIIGSLEYARAKLKAPGLGSESDDGFGIHIGMLARLTQQFSVNAQVGYVSLDGDGVEMLLGARFKPTEQFGIFVDYRMTKLSDSGVDLDLDDLRVGVGFHF
jgi:opacity protein-like surface antigen